MTEMHNETRKIYHKQHTRIINDETTIERIRNIYPEEYFGLGKNWFKGKSAFDAGCGDMIVLSIRMAEFGCANIKSMDIGKEWMENAASQIKKYNIKNNIINLIDGNVMDIPFEKNSFDFVAINGVLCHVKDRSEVEKGFSEGARVCKPGGYFYTTFAVDGGLMEEAIYPAIQKYYYQNEEFREYIDNISPKDFEIIFKQIVDGLKKYEGKTIKSSFNKELFDEDLCITIQNYIQGPNRYELKCSHEFVQSLYRKYGFEEITLLKRYVRFNNVRKYLSPLKYDRESKISKILWGKGFVEYIGKKKE